VVGAIASFAGIGWTFGAIAVASIGLVGWAAAIPGAHAERAHDESGLLAVLGDHGVLGAAWFVVLPALLFGTLSVLAPLRLSALGLGAIGIGAVFLSAAALEAVNNVVVGRITDREGPLRPVLVALVSSTVIAAVLPWPDDRFVLAALVVCAGLAFGTFFTPGMTLLSNLVEERGLPVGYAFALVNLAWAPGQTIGAAGGGTLAHATSDAVPYLTLSAICALTLARLWRARKSTGWTTGSAPGSSGSSSPIIDTA
jgi:predicted MFS family arabinose efflux permease